MSSRRSSSDVKVTPIGVTGGDAVGGKPVLAEKDVETASIQPRRIDLRGGVMMIVSLMIGSGIFTYAGEIHLAVRSTGLALTVWLISGLLALTGALCYAELGTMIPGSGGEGMYLMRGFGPVMTFLFEWTSILILKPGTVAIMSLAFGDHVSRLFGWKHSLVSALVACMGVTLLSAYAPRASTKILDLLTWSKVVALGMIIGGGLIYAVFIDHSIFYNNVLKAPFTANVPTTSADPDSFSTWSFALVTAVCSGLWSFEGWNNLNIVAGDLHNPKRNLPLAIWISVGSVLTLYLATLMGYYCVVPVVNFVENRTIGLTFGEIIAKKMFGDSYEWMGRGLLALFIMGSTFSASLSSMMTSSEIIVLSSANGNLPRVFGRVYPQTGTACNAYWMQGALSVLLTLVFSDKLVIVYTLPTWIFYMLCVMVLLTLRLLAPQLERPYRVWLSTPILFLVSCLLLIGSSTTAYPTPVALSLEILLLGLPVYYWLHNKQDSQN